MREGEEDVREGKEGGGGGGEGGSTERTCYSMMGGGGPVCVLCVLIFPTPK